MMGFHSCVTLETVRNVIIKALSHTLAHNLRHSPLATACRDSTGSARTDSLVWTLSLPCGRIRFPGFKDLPHTDKDQTHTQVLTSPLSSSTPVYVTSSRGHVAWDLPTICL